MNLTTRGQMTMKTLRLAAMLALALLFAAAFVPHDVLPPLVDHALRALAGSGDLALAMSTLTATHPTLMDLKSRLDKDGNVIPVIDMLSQQNEILEDAVWSESNELTGHVTSVRTGLPEPTWRKLYGGVQPAKSTSVKVREGLGMLENYAEVDKALADLNGNSAAWRMSEESAFIEGFGQKLARYMIYGNEATEPEAFTGLAPRFNDQARSTARTS
jgi:hypothetical protein